MLSPVGEKKSKMYFAKLFLISSSVADPDCLSRILGPHFPIPDGGSTRHRIPDPDPQQTFLTQIIVTKLLEIWSGCSLLIADPESRIRIFSHHGSQIQRVKEAPDPGFRTRTTNLSSIILQKCTSNIVQKIFKFCILAKTAIPLAYSAGRKDAKLKQGSMITTWALVIRFCSVPSLRSLNKRLPAHKRFKSIRGKKNTKKMSTVQIPVF